MVLLGLADKNEYKILSLHRITDVQSWLDDKDKAKYLSQNKLINSRDIKI
jgi:hypothetical protein